MPLSSETRNRLAVIPRILVAVLLVVSLLSGVLPSGSASDVHLCTMEACSGSAPHSSGSCHLNISTAQTGRPAEVEKTPLGVAAGVMGMTDGVDSAHELDDVTIEAGGHCGPDGHSNSQENSLQDDRNQSATIITRAYSKPCPPECSTGALSSGIRISRHAATVAFNARPRPPTLGRKRPISHSDFFVTSIFCKQLRPRGPPVRFS